MTEWIVILVIVLIFFGAGKLPDVFAQAGKGLKAFKDASDGRPTGTAADEDAGDEPNTQRKQLASRDPDDLDDGPVEEGASSARKQRNRPS